MSEPKPLCPRTDGWRCVGQIPGYQDVVMWRHPLSGICVSSAVELTSRGPEWHLSISVTTFDARGRQPRLSEAAFALDAFGAAGFERDDHGTHITANYWRPVNRDMEGECPCKT